VVMVFQAWPLALVPVVSLVQAKPDANAVEDVSMKRAETIRMRAAE
jgi:hypothetical protein